MEINSEPKEAVAIEALGQRKTFQEHQQPSSSKFQISNLSTSNLSANSPPFIPTRRAIVPQSETSTCEYCNSEFLTNSEQWHRHLVYCANQHNRKVLSQDKQCNICFENVISKENPGENRFGILLNCLHVFCLDCIRKWRGSRQFGNDIIRACPVCRVSSDFVCPSSYWVEGKEEKDKLVANYRRVMSRVDCRYFKFGTGNCRFGNKCFYRHCDVNFEPIDAGSPRARRNPRRLENLIRSQADEFGRLLLLQIASSWYDESDYDTDDE